MQRQLGAGGDFAWAYVIAHEVGHHVQNQLGTSGGINPDSFTHGSSEQRARWFDTGRERGEPGDCDIFAPDAL